MRNLWLENWIQMFGGVSSQTHGHDICWIQMFGCVMSVIKLTSDCALLLWPIHTCIRSFFFRKVPPYTAGFCPVAWVNYQLSYLGPGLDSSQSVIVFSYVQGEGHRSLGMRSSGGGVHRSLGTRSSGGGAQEPGNEVVRGRGAQEPGNEVNRGRGTRAWEWG